MRWDRESDHIVVEHENKTNDSHQTYDKREKTKYFCFIIVNWFIFVLYTISCTNVRLRMPLSSSPLSSTSSSSKNNFFSSALERAYKCWLYHSELCTGTRFVCLCACARFMKQIHHHCNTHKAMNRPKQYSRRKHWCTDVDNQHQHVFNYMHESKRPQLKNENRKKSSNTIRVAFAFLVSVAAGIKLTWSPMFRASNIFEFLIEIE